MNLFKLLEIVNHKKYITECANGKLFYWVYGRSVQGGVYTSYKILSPDHERKVETI